MDTFTILESQHENKVTFTILESQHENKVNRQSNFTHFEITEVKNDIRTSF